MNRKLLLQADNNLCLKCHSQVQANPKDLLLIGKFDHTSLARERSCLGGRMPQTPSWLQCQQSMHY